jgi:CubicO group peptidase (beta-lactamase class C family)
MKTKRIIKISLLVLAALALVRVAPLAWLFTAGLRTPVAVPAPDYWPTESWQTRTPEELGFDSDKLAEGLLSLQENRSGIDSLLIVHDGYVVLDAHFAPYDGAFPHDLASVTKSVMTTLVAIAAEQGSIDLDRPVVSYFPDRMIANLDERKQRLTVRHLASMRNGMESGCLEGDEPTLDAMRSQPDWVQAALDRPMVSEPGTRNCYDSPGMHLLSAILQEATGMTALDFARLNLFGPLGIHAATWEVDPQGYTRGWGDLHLLPEDAARIGYLWLHRGSWDGRQIVPDAWVLDSVRPHSKFVEGDFGYGYGWWVSWQDYLASGRGGQGIRVMASRNTVLVVTGGGYEYSEVEKWLLPILIGLKGTLPANPEGQAALAAALATIQQDETSTAANPAPEAAQTVSGRTYLCEENPAAIESFRIQFDDPKVAALSLRMSGAEIAWPVGLDGDYRLTPEGTGIRGWWEDERTFQLDVFDVGVLHYQLVFEGERLQIVLPELDLTVPCQAQND